MTDRDADPSGSSDHAYDELRRRILVGELAPGASVSQVQIAQQLGISRTPLREAIRRLQSEGLVRSELNRKVRVSPLTSADFDQLYAMRIPLDSLAIRISTPQLSPAELEETRSLLVRITAAAEAGDVAAYREPHRRFHMALSAHAGARLLVQIETLWDHAERYRRLYAHHAGEMPHLVQLANRDHAAILEAAEQRDTERCAKRVAAHLARTALMTMASIDHQYDPVGIRHALDLVGGEEALPSLQATSA